MVRVSPGDSFEDEPTLNGSISKIRNEMNSSDEEGAEVIAGTGGTVLPPWTAPPTGEIPQIYSFNREQRSAIDLDRSDVGALAWAREGRLLNSSSARDDLFERQSLENGRHFNKRPVNEGSLELLNIDDLGSEPLGKHSVQGFSTAPVRSVSSRGISFPSFRTRERLPRHESLTSNNGVRDIGMAESVSADASSYAPKIPDRERSGSVLSRLMKDNGTEMTDGDSSNEESEIDSEVGRTPLHRERSHTANKSTRLTRGSSRKRSSVTIRVITGVLLGIITISTFLVGQRAFIPYLIVVILLAVKEFYELARQDHSASPKGGYSPAVLVGLIGTVALIVAAYTKGAGAMTFVLSLTLVASFLWYLTGVLSAPLLPNASITFIAVAWIGLGGGFAALIVRPIAGDPLRGMAFMMAIILTTVAADIFAYFGGSWIGRRKLAPSVSPGKTIEGLLIGTLGAILTGSLLASHIHPITVSVGGTIGVLASIAGPCGDLIESKIKREIGAKDAGSILPGHGGFLDRLDALIFVTPVVYYFLYFGHYI